MGWFGWEGQYHLPGTNHFSQILLPQTIWITINEFRQNRKRDELIAAQRQNNLLHPIRTEPPSAGFLC